MARLCEHCNEPVGIGQGVWRGHSNRPETMRLFHSHPSVCAEPRQKRTLTPEHIAKIQAGRQTAAGTLSGNV
jgi:hypothetical protein